MLAEARRWPDRMWAIEGCQGIGRHLANRLLADGEQVVDVPPKLSARTRVFATGQGRKTDATDAHSVALAATRMQGLRPVADDAQLAAPDAPGHAQSSKRAMAGDIVALMRHFGHARFSVVGHDRGALVAFRTAMDHPDAVERLVVMDGLPVIEHLERLNGAFVRTWWHWWFLGQTDKPAEAFINADPGRWYRTPSPAEMGEDNHADVWAAFCDPAVVHGMCEDYRAGLRIDRAHEEADRAAGRKIGCPMLLLASTGDDLDIHGDPEAIWRPWVAGQLHSRPIYSGHHQAEEAPDELAAALLEFLGRPTSHHAA
jgi:haloacetate dehalogenase